ncbi:hypothetical protein A7U60_g2826 [Sanghuangporus baumii]|uniref:Programmed cell death protein 2 C-terminal domain-containing protein n=1 Tax=Sanghuangporus baumii TaxID=108892 RepID=A0A9Q5NAL2_SANBA|nr:hypothetical protein A7U60_g2826 [Sanghuangporus baumii]
MAIPTKHEDDWSDSDEEDECSDVETSVLLGIPDGEIEKQGDLDDAAVSRIGGHPLWCPFENSPMDRALYVFGCSRRECQHKPGSIRAFRGLRYNATYAARLEKKRAREREKEAARFKEEEEKKKSVAKVNPFSMTSSAVPSVGLFGVAPTFGNGLGTQLFGTSEPDFSKIDPSPEKDDDEEAPPPPESESESEPEDADAESTSESSEKSILAAPAHTPSSSSPWLAAPAYTPPFYLSTAQEYVPPAPKPPKLSSSVQEGDEGDEDGKGRGKSKKAELRRAEKEKEDEKDRKAWENAMEGYEDSLEVDKVFEKFARVAGYEGEQCIRYELGGTPLPYSNDTIFKCLFPSPSASISTMTPVSSSTKFTPSTVTPARRMYDPRSNLITPCPRCGGPRTFECQLMPHLISVFHSNHSQKRKQGQAPVSEEPEARKQEIESFLRGSGQGGGGEKASGMEWGTCMVFSCSQDCCLDPVNKEEAKELWAEELVLVQWDE